MYKIYQIPNETLEKLGAVYMAQMFLGTKKATKEKFDKNYKLAWESEDELDLDLIYDKFNTKHPQGYTGRSLSCGDIVELSDGLYQCMMIGWEKLKYSANIIKIFDTDEKYNDGRIEMMNQGYIIVHEQMVYAETEQELQNGVAEQLQVEFMPVRCCYCGESPNKIIEYVESAKDSKCTPVEYVANCDGTYNKDTGEFACTDCYIAYGMPLGKAPFTDVQVTPKEYINSGLNETIINEFVSDIEQDFKDAGLKIHDNVFVDDHMKPLSNETLNTLKELNE